MDNGTTATDASATATAAAPDVTEPVAGTGRALRSATRVETTPVSAGQAKPSQGKGKKPARRGNTRVSRRDEAFAAPAGLQGGSMSRTSNQEQDYPTVAHPIFAVSAAPKVEDTSHEALTRWVDLRLEYEEVMRARCEASGEDLKSVMRSIRNSFDDSFLETLCETKWDKKKEELTDEFIWDWIMKTVQSFKNNILPNIDELFQDQLMMATAKTDVDARVMDYFHLCNMIVKNNGLAGLFSGDDGTKKKCKILLSCLPDELKARVKNEIDFRLPAAKSSVAELFKIVSEKALEIDREDKALSRNKRRSSGLDAKPSAATRPPKRAKTVMESGKSRGSRPQGAPRQIFRTNSEQSQPGPKGGCWTCGGQHRQADCPEKPESDASPARKQKPGRHRKVKAN